VGKDVDPANYAHQDSVFEKISLKCFLTFVLNQKALVLQEDSRHVGVALRWATRNKVVCEV